MARIVIAGAGYGGVMAGKKFENNHTPFVMINKHSYHQFITWLHEAAGGRNHVDDYKVELTDIFSRHGTMLVKDEVTGIDRQENKLLTTRGSYPYDYAIIALGSAPEFFGIPGLSEYSMQLRSLETARQIRTRIEREFARFKDHKEDKKLRIVVGGAGLTGIEFVGELLEWLPKLCTKLGISPSSFEVITIEATDTILPALMPSLQKTARDVLEHKGAKIMISTKIERVEEGRVYLGSGEVIEAETIVWTGGVRANMILSQAGLTCDRRGRAEVNDYLQSTDDERLFIIGDCASLVQAGRPLPPTAQMATQMGQLAAKNILALLAKEPMQKFHPKMLGTLASLGSEQGVGTLGKFPTSGATAGLAKDLTKVKYLYQLGGLRMVTHIRKPLLKQTAWQV